MKPEIHAAWIADLRSGKHEQVKEKLCDGTGYCCLGRLTELYREANPNVMFFTGNEYIWLDTKGLKHEEEAELPSVVMNWAMFKTTAGMLPNELFSQPNECLARLNDDGLTFPQIADVIEYLGPEAF